MGRVILDVSVSLDGYAAGPNVRMAEAMGDGGEQLHAWMGGAGPGSDVDARMMSELNASVGATIIGRRTFDLGLPHWGGTPWPATPSFVVTHEQRPDLAADNGGTFAFTSLTDAVHRARDAAGDKDAMILGPTISQQLLNAGLVDEVWLHIAPVLLGGGIALFEGVKVGLVPVGQPIAGAITHLRLRPTRR